MTQPADKPADLTWLRDEFLRVLHEPRQQMLATGCEFCVGKADALLDLVAAKFSVTQQFGMKGGTGKSAPIILPGSSPDYARAMSIDHTGRNE